MNGRLAILTALRIALQKPFHWATLAAMKQIANFHFSGGRTLTATFFSVSNLERNVHMLVMQIKPNNLQHK